MNKIKYGFYAIAIAVAVYFFWSDEKAKIELQNPENLPALKELVAKQFDPNLEVQEMKFEANDNLSSVLGSINATYWKDEKSAMDLYYSASEKKVEERESFLTKGRENLPEAAKAKPKGKKAIKDFDLDSMIKDYDEAVKIINEEAPDTFNTFKLRRYSYEVNKDQKVTVRFYLQATEQGATTKVRGRQRITEYYEFIGIREEGKDLVIKDN